jgi:hypothetical protein
MPHPKLAWRATLEPAGLVTTIAALLAPMLVGRMRTRWPRGCTR